MIALRLRLLAPELAICHLAPEQDAPAWSETGPLQAMVRTEDELSLVCLAQSVPQHVRAETGWKAFKVQGPLDLSLVGVLAALSQVLAAGEIPVFVISTFDTDYLLVKQAQVEKAQMLLSEAGHQVTA